MITVKMNREYILERLSELEAFLNQNWKSLSDNFVQRLLARAEYDKLLQKLKTIK